MRPSAKRNHVSTIQIMDFGPIEVPKSIRTHGVMRPYIVCKRRVQAPALQQETRLAHGVSRVLVI